MNSKSRIQPGDKPDWGAMALRVGDAVIEGICFAAMMLVVFAATAIKAALKLNPGKPKY